ncbi:MAG: CaiB/BaiF CoA transferase family protein, partial [Negativicutes bacterium]
MEKPLKGLKVIDLSTVIAVPKAARILAEWGADVIKVEPPSGEPMRTMGKTWGVLPYTEDYNPAFQTENMHKRSIVMDLKKEDGKAAFLKLIEKADIFMTNVRMGSLQKLGLGYEELTRINQGLIYAYFTGYGDKGPEKDKPGFDTTAFWSKSGAMIEWVFEGGRPFRPLGGFGDGACASMLLSGILLALYKRKLTGEGEIITTSLYANALWLNSGGVLMGQPR